MQSANQAVPSPHVRQRDHSFMATHEPEITDPVDLCDRGGHRLAADARGWSRTPLHTANLSGSWGRNKRWDYWAILAGDLVVSAVYADVDYLGLADIWWCELSSGTQGGAAVQRPLARGIHLPDRPGSEPLIVHSGNLDMAIEDAADGSTRISATWVERDGSAGRLDAIVELPARHESLNVVIPWNEKRFQYTSKHQARPARGVLESGGKLWEFTNDPENDPENEQANNPEKLGEAKSQAWGVLDVGRGRWPYRTIWNWAGGAGLSEEGAVIGLQFGGKWTIGTGSTENGVIVNGRLTKIGVELDWAYRWEDPMSPWHVTSPDGSVDAVLTPRFDKHTRVQAAVLATETHQVFGNWSGTIRSDDGTRHAFDGIQGFAEESRSRW